MGKRILVIEDDPEMRLLTTSILARRGYQTVSVETGCQALAEMRRALFDLVVLDLLLPDTNGLTLCEEIKRQNFMAYIPVILLTSVTAEGVVRQGFKVGADEYMVKPPSPIDLVNRVQDLLSQAERRNPPDQPFPRAVFA
jgi:DNA-binding response OmpR family regulator